MRGARNIAVDSAMGSQAHTPLPTLLTASPCPHADVAVISLDALAGAGGAPGASARLSFFGVFDGHGGRNVAQLAAEQLNPCCLVAGLQQEAARVAAAAGGAQAGAAGGGEPAAAQQAAAQQQPSAKACKAAIVEGFRELDRRVLERCAAANWPDGCTAVAAWVIGELVLVANVGDARCVLARCPLPAAAPAGGEGQPAAGAAAAVGVGQGRQQLAQQAQQEQAAQAALEPLKAVVLTREHKAIFPGERQRIERAGSFVSGDGRLAGARRCHCLLARSPPCRCCCFPYCCLRRHTTARLRHAKLPGWPAFEP